MKKFRVVHYPGGVQHFLPEIKAKSLEEAQEKLEVLKLTNDWALPQILGEAVYPSRSRKPNPRKK